MTINPLRRRKVRKHSEHRFEEHPIGAGLVRRVCGECGQVRLTRNAWPLIRWAVRNEQPGIFVALRPTMFLSAPLWGPEVQPTAHRFGQRRVA